MRVSTLFQGLDVMPVVSPGTAENRPSLGQPTRLRLTGRTKLSGRLSPQPDQAVPSTQLPASAFEGGTHTRQTASERQELSSTYLAHHELESVIITVIIIMLMLMLMHTNTLHDR